MEINVNEITISFDDYGAGKLPIIFIHGFPFDKSSWEPQMMFLKKTHQVIAYDIRGFGLSTAGKEPVTISLFADDLLKFMNSMEIDKAIVCGLSMGGYIVLNAVYRYPERFKAIIFSDTQCLGDSQEAKEQRKQTVLQINKDGLATFADGFVKKVFCQESLDTKKELVNTIRKTILSTSKEAITGTLMALAERWDMCSSLNQITVPTLILCGSEDTVTPPGQSKYLHSNIANSTLKIIDNAGHLANLEQPDMFNQHLSDFISTLS